MGLSAVIPEEEEANFRQEMLQKHLVSLFNSPEERGIAKKVKLKDLQDEIIKLIKTDDSVMMHVRLSNLFVH